MARRRVMYRLVLAGALMAAVPGAVETTPLPVAAQAALDFVPTWSAGPFTNDKAQPIAESSPMVATLDGQGPSVVVGDRTGYLYAYHLGDGTPVAGWPRFAGGAPIDSTPSTLRQSNGLDHVFVGAGNAGDPTAGGYLAYGPTGARLWTRHVADPPTDTAPAQAVQASLTVVGFPPGPAVFAGSLDQETYAFGAGNGRPLTGWPFFSADSVFSTAAAGDLYGTGRSEVVMGGASTAGYALGQQYPQGGHLRILNSQGGLACHYDTSQEVDSSPAVGPFLAGGREGIVVGTGTFFPGASQTDTLLGFDTSCDLLWSRRLDAATSSSPAVADVLGDGRYQIAEGTDNGTTGGSVWLLDGGGRVIWQQAVKGRVIGSVTTADLTGLGYQDVLVPTTHGVEVLDGRSHQDVADLGDGNGFQNSPLVTDDPNGTVGVTVAGYTGANEGIIFHYELPGSSGAQAVEPLKAWPMFHHDPHLTGMTGRRPGGSPCQAANAANPGYDLVASDGGVFSFGRAAFCGSTGRVRLAKPIVGMALAPNHGGYWLVASDGGIFAFGGARFYGSLGRVALAKPIVGMASTSDGRGYWLVASDGGIFPFGDAHFYGSAGTAPLPHPVVGMVAAPSGHGYTLVGSDGRVFNYGDPPWCGSTVFVHLAHPVVGIAVDRQTGCYWLAASDGGVFAFASQYHGGLGQVHLARPIVAIVSTSDGGGYWLIASDGGVFAFGDAHFYGSTGGIRLARPVIAAGGFY